MRFGVRHWTLGLAIAASLATLPAMAATGGLTITATVLSASNCKFRAGSGTLLNFGAIDPSQSTNATGTVTLVIRCGGSAATASYSLAADDGLHGTGPGLRRMRHTVNAAEFLAYSLDAPRSGTATKNVDTSVVLTGTITPAQYAGALGGSFSDTLVLTLSP